VAFWHCRCINNLAGINARRSEDQSDEQEVLNRVIALPQAYITHNGFRSPVRNQGECGTCASFATMDNCETNWRRTSK
jgi:C1A family cysteine protease